MTQEELVSLGFERVDVSKEESGDEAFFYYTLDFGLSRVVSLISCDDKEAKSNNGWYVEVFEDESIRYDKYQDVSEFIRIINKGIEQ